MAQDDPAPEEAAAGRTDVRRPSMNRGKQSRSLSRPAVPPAPLPVWFTPGSDYCYYSIAQKACQESRRKLSKLKLSPDESQLLTAIPIDSNAVDEKLKGIMDEKSKQLKRPAPRAMTRSSEFYTKFCDAVAKTGALFKPLQPLGSEYLLPFGLLMILFKAVVTKKDREESLMVHLEALTAKLPPTAFYHATYPSSQAKVALVNVYVKVFGFLDDALVYYRIGRLHKLIDAILEPADARFARHLSQIEADVKALESFKTAPHEAPVNTASPVTETGKLVARLYENSEKAIVTVGVSMEHLNDRLSNLEQRITQMASFERFNYAQSLQTALLSSPMDMYWDAEGGLARITATGFRLAPKDHWENNGILESLVEWTRGPDQGPLLWVGGQSGGPETWVTEMATDLVHAFSQQPSTLLYIFCTELLANSIIPTPVRLVKFLIIQLLTLHPELVYENPMVYNVQRFQHAATFGLAFQILESLLMSVNDVFLVIDRIEECVPDEQANLTKHFLPALMRLLHRTGGARAIITSIYEPPEELLESDDEGLFESVYIDTAVKMLNNR